MLMYTMPTNITGLVVNNMGYYANNIPYAVGTFFQKAIPQFARMEKIGQVIGYGPYYCSRPEFNAHLAIDREYAYKHNVEKVFQSIRCSTVTLLHDGVDDYKTRLVSGDLNAYQTTDNILYDTALNKQETQGNNK